MVILLSGLSESSKEKIESYIFETMRKNRVPGLSICITRGGNKIYSKGFGQSRLEPPRPASADTLYGVGSVTKAFTAMSILKLVEDGKIALEDPVGKYVPGFSADTQAEPVTIHRLLTHTSGFPDLGVAEEVVGRTFGVKINWTPLGGIEDLVTLINEARRERVSANGDVFFYWNEGYALLGAVIERVTKESYASYVTRSILKPLGMTRSTFSKEEFEADKDAMTGYVLDKDGVRRPQKFPFHPLVEAAGGLISSVSELANFVGMFLGRGNYSGTQIVSEDTLVRAMTPYVRHSLPPAMAGGAYYGYGLIINDNFHGYKLVGHGGNIGVSSAYFGFIPELDVGVTLASNSDFRSDAPALYALSVACDMDPEDVLPFVSFEKKCELLRGRYESYKGGLKMSIVQRDLNLFIELSTDSGGSVLLPLIIEGDRVFVSWGPERTELHVEAHSDAKVDVFLERVVYHKVGTL
jgi:CubicO group peptidase (beta-lactamase class C family)